jgi:hypothetical protein
MRRRARRWRPGTIYGTLERLDAGGLAKEVPAARSDRRRTFATATGPAGGAPRRSAAALALAALVRAKRLVPRES